MKYSKAKYRTLVKVRDHSFLEQIDSQGRKLIPTRWVEVSEINFGSMMKPNKEIIEFKLEQVITLRDIFGGHNFDL